MNFESNKETTFIVYLSKSKYRALWQCAKIAWLKKYKPKQLELDLSVLAHMDAENEVGNLVMGLFGKYAEATAYNNEKIDISRMIKTQDLK